MSDPQKPSFERRKLTGCPLTDEEWQAAVEAGKAEVRARHDAAVEEERRRKEAEVRAQLQLQRDIAERAEAEKPVRPLWPVK